MEFELIVGHWQTKPDSLCKVRLLLYQGLNFSTSYIDKFDCLMTFLYHKGERVDVEVWHKLSEDFSTILSID